MAAVIAERVISIVNLHAEASDAARSEVMDVVDKSVSRYEIAITSARTLLSTLAVTPELSSGKLDTCDTFETLVDSSPSVETLSLVDTNGRITCSTVPWGVGLDIGRQDHFRIALLGVSYLNAVSRNLSYGLPSVYLSQPILLDDGEVLGVIVARIDVAGMFPNSLVQSLRATSELLVVDAAGVVITASDPDDGLAGRDLSGLTPIRAAMSRSTGTVTGIGPDGVERLYGFARLPESNMHLLVGADQSQLVAQVWTSTTRAGTTLLAAILVMLGGLWLVGENLIVAPVRALAYRLVRFGHGEREEDAPEPVIAELEPLATAFKAMAEELTRRESALRNANRRLSSLASLDPLTGIANRRSFDAVLAVQWGSARQLAVLMFDIDHFKAFNDHFGHLAGDRCLRRVAQALAGPVRATDIVARLGGEEFAVLMPETTLEEAREVAERLRDSVAELAIPHAEAVGSRVTVSVGCAACVPGLPLRAGDLLAAADRALYRAKQMGRDRVVTTPLVEPDHAAARQDGRHEGQTRQREA